MKFILAVIFTSFTLSACNGNGSKLGPLSGPDDTEAAVALVEDANSDLKRIRVLYRENNSRVAELETALTNNDIEKVKKLTDDLSLVILDGYALAETAKEKLEKAQRLNINQDFKYYLAMKEEGLTLQIKAFDYRRDSAKLFRDKFGSNDQSAMSEAARKFKENEANFKKFMAEATKISEQADQLYKEVNSRKRN